MANGFVGAVYSFDNNQISRRLLKRHFTHAERRNHVADWHFSALASTMLGYLSLVNNGHNARSVESRMSEITKDTHATLHQLVAGEDTIKEQGRLKDLVLRYISLTGGQRPEYFITIDQVEYLPKQIERWAREFGLI